MRAARAWKKLGGRIVENASRSSLWIVVDIRLDGDALAFSQQALVEAVVIGRPVHAIELGSVAAHARQLFSDHVSQKSYPDRAGNVRDLDRHRQTKRTQ
jgi:hypothetical protein